MSRDITEQVLAAFQAEHQEHLEGIRAVLAAWTGDDAQNTAESIDEAFRLAHSLKGGARVCDLRPPESLAHGLENVFEELRGGTLALEADVVRAINLALDGIEDWMAALRRGESPEELDEAQTAIDQLLDRCSDNGGNQVDDEVSQRLRDVFLSECPEYLNGLRTFIERLGNVQDTLTSTEMEQVFHFAHNLRGSASAANIDSIRQATESLESTLAAFIEGSMQPDEAVTQQLLACLDFIDQRVSSLQAGTAVRLPSKARKLQPDHSVGSTKECVPSSTTPAADALPSKSSGTAVPAPAVASSEGGSVRISTESLDRLLRSSQSLVTESVRQNQVSRELDELWQLVSQLERERESIRRLATAGMNKLSNVPEFNRLANYFDTIDRGILALTRRTRNLCSLQQRNAWLLQTRGRSIQQDVRQARMVPAGAVYQAFRKMVRDLAAGEGKQVDFHASGFDVRADRMVFQVLKDPLIHLLRNCIVHGIESPEQRAAGGKSETSRIELSIVTKGNRLTIEVRDDGRGIDRAAIVRRAVERGMIRPDEVAERSAAEIDHLIFEPGFSTSNEVNELSGRGMGLSVVREAVARLQGSVELLRNVGVGTAFRISVPLCISTHRLLLVSVADQTYALPVHGIERLLRVKANLMETIEGIPVVTFNERPIPLVTLASVLGIEEIEPKCNGTMLQIAILKSGTRRLALNVDAFVAERDLLIQDLDQPSTNDRYLGAVLLEEGNVALVLNPAEVIEQARPATKSDATLSSIGRVIEQRKPRILVVDDSITTRTLEKSILEANGYDVGIAVDGVEGLNRLRSEHFDLVISDLEMPRMNGFGLLEQIKKDTRLASTPVILVTSRSHRADQERGLDLGAEAYIVKQKFDHQALLSTIQQVVNTAG